MSKRIYLKDLAIGGGAPVSIQAMIKTPVSRRDLLFSEITQLIDAGAQAIRVAIKTEEDIGIIPELLERFEIPFIADVHFNYKVAINVIKTGIHGIRLNPGNIADRNRISDIIKAVNDYNPNIVIRVGVNSGSLPEDLQGIPRTEAMVEAAQRYISILEDLNFYNIKVSLKSSDVRETIEANRIFRQKSDYPIHLGVTATGGREIGIVKSCIGIGSLLLEGIGDTIRVSLCSDSLSEVKLAKEILLALSLRKGLQIISCPTCGRATVDIRPIVNKLHKMIDSNPELFKGVDSIAVMGCEVNGPGEAKHADIGVACGKACAFLFKKGKIIRRVRFDNVIEAIIEEISMIGRRS